MKFLKKDLINYQKQYRTVKTGWRQKYLKRKVNISSADEQWLDNEGNIIDEQCVLDDLEAASDYERGVAQLDKKKKGKAIVRKLKELTGDLVKAVGKKQNHKKCFMHLQGLLIILMKAYIEYEMAAKDSGKSRSLLTLLSLLNVNSHFHA